MWFPSHKAIFVLLCAILVPLPFWYLPGHATLLLPGLGHHPGATGEHLFVLTPSACCPEPPEDDVTFSVQPTRGRKDPRTPIPWCPCCLCSSRPGIAAPREQSHQPLSGSPSTWSRRQSLETPHLGQVGSPTLWAGGTHGMLPEPLGCQWYSRC